MYRTSTALRPITTRTFSHANVAAVGFWSAVSVTAALNVPLHGSAPLTKQLVAPSTMSAVDLQHTANNRKGKGAKGPGELWQIAAPTYEQCR